jgi:hypothetical protein
MILDDEPSPIEQHDPGAATITNATAMATHQLDGAGGTLADPSPLSHTLSNPMPIPSPAQRILPDGSSTTSSGRHETTRTPSPTGAPLAGTNGHEGPITPRNDAGPWVFDGSGVRLSEEGVRPAAAAVASQNQGQDQSGVSRAGSLEAAVQAAGPRM